MHNHSTRKSAKGSTSKNRQPKTNPLAKYEAQARPILRMYFAADTPAFVRDLIGSWLGQLENETQVFWNVPEIARVALPLMLRQADRLGLEVEAPSSRVTLDALHETITLNDRDPLADIKRTEAAHVREQLEADAAAISRLLSSPYAPDSLKVALHDHYAELTDPETQSPEAVRAVYVPAMLKRLAAQERGEQ